MKLTDLSNDPVYLTKYKGKTIFINFWATWCKPCREEMPSIQRAMGILKDENIVFLFASNESAELIENFKSDHDYDFTYVKADNLEELNIIGLPTTFIFDPDGNLVFSEMGYRQWDDKTNIDLLLNISKPK
jgi:thiol-disulfide isomerase/thioredoxin